MKPVTIEDVLVLALRADACGQPDVANELYLAAYKVWEPVVSVGHPLFQPPAQESSLRPDREVNSRREKIRRAAEYAARVLLSPFH